jgi:hypothetical protein
MDRDPEVGGNIRAYNPRGSLPKDLDHDIWSWKAPNDAFSGGDDEKPRGMKDVMRSSVLLAACRPDESAGEDIVADDKWGGLFTAALIPAMKSRPGHTYHSLFASLKVKGQHPCCVGINQFRTLFSIVHNEGFLITKEVDRYYVLAGSIHGVEIGFTTFRVQGGAETSDELCPENVEAGRSLLKPSSAITDSIRATIKQGHHREDLFNFYLTHMPPVGHQLPMRHNGQPIVRFVMKQLKQDPWYGIWKPASNAQDVMSTPASDVSLAGEAKINNADVYGFQLVNNGPESLYLYVLYFDTDTYCVQVE